MQTEAILSTCSITIILPIRCSRTSSSVSANLSSSPSIANPTTTIPTPTPRSTYAMPATCRP
ncbi:hypothetical protein FIBSPDRAFT_602811 [Athelia psychrophila]|uniref:Uncharacterized protein n=1 Tax=Athelia psychrophila TaxID=1759441 RepID=A0A166GQ27_9AGAM|nr:hypothetical protein FIBSPDRAFT_602811 [Fibularhizoctonia sp. CBS 109695]